MPKQSTTKASFTTSNTNFQKCWKGLTAIKQITIYTQLRIRKYQSFKSNHGDELSNSIVLDEENENHKGDSDSQVQHDVNVILYSNFAVREESTKTLLQLWIVVYLSLVLHYENQCQKEEACNYYIEDDGENQIENAVGRVGDGLDEVQ